MSDWWSHVSSPTAAGTPLQNDLTELKTLLSFLEPGVFGENGEQLDALEVCVSILESRKDTSYSVHATRIWRCRSQLPAAMQHLGC